MQPRFIAAAAAITLAVVIVFWQVFVRLVDAWIVDGNYSHGFLIIPIALYFVWERREKLAAAPVAAAAGSAWRCSPAASRCCSRASGARNCS